MLSAKREYGIWLDLRTKLVLILTVMVVTASGSFAGVHLILRIICTAIPCVLLLNIRQYQTAVVYIFLLSAAIVCELYLIPKLTGAVNIFLVLICGLVSRFIAGYMMGMYMVRSTSVSEFVTAMEKMKMPYFLTIPMSVMFRYFPTLGEEYRSIHDAMRMREIGQSVKNPLTYIEYVLVPIMMSTVRIADELSAASLTKGLSAGGKRTHICEVKMGVADWLISLGSAVMIVLFFVF